MLPLTKQTAELIVDVLTTIHVGTVEYPDYATEEAIAEIRKINTRFKELMKQDISGVEAFRQAKIEWLTAIASDRHHS